MENSNSVANQNAQAMLDRIKKINSFKKALKHIREHRVHIDN